MQRIACSDVPRKAVAVVAATALLCGVMPARAISQSHPGRACPQSGIRWTEPVTRPGLKFVWPELVLGQGAAYAFGFVPAAVPAPSRGIVALRGGIEELGLPAGAIDFFDPVLAVDRTGTLHALWGEHEAGGGGNADLTRSSSVEQFRLGRVLHARYRNGRWTRAEVVYQAPVVSWHRSLLSRLEEDPSGNLHVAFVAERPPKPNVLVHLRLGTDGWRTTEWVGEPVRRIDPPLPADSVVPGIGGIYPSLAIGPGGRIYIAFASAAISASGRRIPGGDTNSLWVRRSDDAGRTWSAPVLVHRSGSMGGYELQILAIGRDTVHLLWQKQLDQKPGEDEIWHAISADGGVTWGNPAAVRPPGPDPLRNLRAVATVKGELYIAFAHRPPTLANSGERMPSIAEHQIFYAHWRGSGWSVPRPLRRELHVPPFDLRIDRADRLHLLWPYMVRPESGGGEARRFLSYAVASPCVS